MHVILLEAAVEQLGVTATAVNVLLMLDCELNNQRLFLVADGRKLRRQAVKPGILRCLNTCKENNPMNRNR